MIVYFHPDTIRSSWSLWASARALRLIGHDVWDVAIPTDWNGCVTAGALENAPTLDDIRAATVLVMAPEYVDAWLCTYYGEQWIAVPKAGFFVESVHRPDVCLDWGACAHYARRFWPDPQDAAEFGGTLHEAHVDTNVFRPTSAPKRIDVGFVGTLYPKREAFLAQLSMPICTRPVMAYTAFGEAQEAWARCYVESLCAFRVGVDLPSNNPMMTARPYETMAAGTCLVTWAKLPAALVESVDYVRYTSAHELDVALSELLTDPARRESIARNGCERVQQFDSARVWARMLALTPAVGPLDYVSAPNLPA